MGAGQPEDPAGAGRGLSSPALAALARWEESGAHWRVAELSGDRASVDLCACTGERVDGLEVTDPAGLAALRTRRSSDVDPA